jgi:WD40 repeat protein
MLLITETLHARYTGGTQGNICVQSATSPYGGERAIVGHTDYVLALRVGADGTLYSSSADKTIRVWTADGKHLRTLEGHTGSVLDILLESTGQKLFSCSSDKTVRVWSVADGADLQTLIGHTDRVCSLAEGPGGRLYSASEDRTIRVWSVGDGAHVQTLDGGDGGVKALAMTPDGRLISASGVYYNKM